MPIISLIPQTVNETALLQEKDGNQSFLLLLMLGLRAMHAKNF